MTRYYILTNSMGSKSFLINFFGGSLEFCCDDTVSNLLVCRLTSCVTCDRKYEQQSFRSNLYEYII